MKLRKGQTGQALVEAILIMSIMLGLATAVTSYFRKQEFFAKLVSGNWQYIAGMIENGVWLPADKGRALHPNQIDRHSTPLNH